MKKISNKNYKDNPNTFLKIIIFQFKQEYILEINVTVLVLRAIFYYILLWLSKQNISVRKGNEDITKI